MAVEAIRGCGYRKVGGLYLVSGGGHHACHRLPIPLTVCPTCGEGVRQTRSIRWVEKRLLEPPCDNLMMASLLPDEQISISHCQTCPICRPEQDLYGLIWVGEKFYPTPYDFVSEAEKLGVSRRIATIPKKIILGKTWILLAHPKAVPQDAPDPNTGKVETKFTPGIFYAFLPERIEQIVTKTQSEDVDFMCSLEKRRFSPVIIILILLMGGGLVIDFYRQQARHCHQELISSDAVLDGIRDCLKDKGVLRVTKAGNLVCG